MYNRIIKSIPNKNQKITKLPLDVEETCKIINQNDFIISMRYHITLISNILDKNILTIILNKHRHYLNKMYGLIDNYRFADNIVEFDSKIPIENIERLLKNQSSKLASDRDISRVCNEACKDLKEAIIEFLG